MMTGSSGFMRQGAADYGRSRDVVMMRRMGSGSAALWLYGG